MWIHAEPSKHATGVAGVPPLLLALAAALVLAAPAPGAGAEPKAAGKARPGATKKTEGARANAPRLSAAEVVKRHVAARGGAQAWRAVQALRLSGKMEAGSGDSVARSMRIARPGPGTRKARRELAAAGREAAADKQVELPFTLAMQRPNRSRLEIEFAGKTAVQVYDGANGWKVRPFLNRDDVEPLTADETRVQAESPELDGLLLGAASKGNKVELEGVERVEGHDAYKLKVTSKAGAVRRVWVDARSFLDVKVEGAPRRMDGKMHAVWVYQRGFRTVEGLKVPFVLETVVDGYPQTHKIHLEKVAVNPKLAASTFSRPKA